jgi:hypothetical protein
VETPKSPAKSQKTEEGRHFDENFSEVQSLPLSYSPSQKIDEKVETWRPSGDLPSVFEVNGYRVRFYGGEE